jgi:sugar phosphate isomerase/epimerase
VRSRVSVSAVSSWSQPFEADLSMWKRLGVHHVGLSLRKCEAIGLELAAARTAEAGLAISNVVECGWCPLDDRTTWDAQRARLIAAARLFDTPFVVTTGPAGTLTWDEAARAFRELFAPVLDAGVRLAVENTSPLRLDLSFTTTLHDTVDLATASGIGVCLEVNSCWAERGLDATVRSAGPLITHVQLSDWQVGSLSTPDRCVPGDGDIPLAHIVGTLEAAGYRGAYELELVGPRIEAEGYERAISRSIDATRSLLVG